MNYLYSNQKEFSFLEPKEYSWELFVEVSLSSEEKVVKQVNCLDNRDGQEGNSWI